MSLSLMTQVWQLEQDLKPVETIVLLKLADNSDEISHQSFPSIPSIAKQCKISERTVQRTLEKLKEKGLISLIPRYRDNGSRSSNIYQLHLNNPIAQVESDAQSKIKPHDKMTPGWCQNDGGGGDTRDTRVVTTLSPHINHHSNRHNEKNIMRKSCAKDSALRFDEFWSEYPVKKDKKRAKGIWEKKNLDDIANDIISHVKQSKDLDQGWLDGFAPHPSTYLNGERWNDEITTKKGNQNASSTRNLSTADIYEQQLYAAAAVEPAKFIDEKSGPGFCQIDNNLFDIPQADNGGW
ncbi:helix-turn-helix domain-containing protein [Piscirickettsia salmonis]|uniref:helix-turn-helix domain-containing protein n=1 Tax=Piscirickettsia salmonis TaxID=1238 RepID=UPI003EB9755C